MYIWKYIPHEYVLLAQVIRNIQMIYTLHRENKKRYGAEGKHSHARSEKQINEKKEYKR